MASLFDPISIGALTLNNRIVMAPMSRSRAGADGVPTPLMATYYAQRAGAGLIIGEGTQPSIAGRGYADTPGLHAPAQVEGWRRVTDAVHAAGGRIFAQLQHVGRIGDPDARPEGCALLAPSPVRAGGQLTTAAGKKDFVTPREMTVSDIATTVHEYAAAALNAMRAGFDGVELHAGAGYLLHQFLAGNTNRRTDAYGGSVEKRARFVYEVTEAVASAIGADRLGVRIYPGSTINDIHENDTRALYTLLVHRLARMQLAYLHVREMGDRELTLHLRTVWPGLLILNPRHTAEQPSITSAVARVIEDGTADLVSLGRLFLANPDLPGRLRAGGPFNRPDPATFYGGDARGYTDYPTLDAEPVAAPDAVETEIA